MPPTQQITQFLSFLTILSILFLFYILITRVLFKKQFKEQDWFKKNWRFIQKHSLKLAFLVGLTATLGSLYYSEIAGWTPCKLCWFQRVFMYPMPLLTGVALYYKEKAITKYITAMSVVGAPIALYHYLIQRFPSIAEACGAGGGVSCAITYVFTHRFITIPFMALTAFIMILVLGLIWKKGAKQTK